MKINKNLKNLLRKILPELFIQMVGKYLFGRVDEIFWIHNMFRDRKGVMIDVGAHFGSSMRLFLENEWRVFAFEPSDKNRQVLLQKYKDVDLLTIHDYGLSDICVKDVEFYESTVSTGISSVSKFHRSHEITQKVELKTLESFVESENLTSIDFLKIDTEGHDLAVLKGVPWGQVRPEVILCEYEDRKTLPLGHNVNDIANYLVDLGYVVFVSEWHPIVEYGGNHKWRRVFKFDTSETDSSSWGNLIAIRADLNDEYSSKINKYW